MTGRILTGAAGAMLLFLAAFLGPATAAGAANDRQTIGNVEIYLGVIPAEMIRGLHPPSHSESTMHGGIPTDSGDYHVTIALFNAKTAKRISGAKVRARVAEIGQGGEEKQLQPMKIAGTITYGNYFPMEGNGPFRIYVNIRLPGHPGEISAQFEHWHH